MSFLRKLFRGHDESPPQPGNAMPADSAPESISPATAPALTDAPPSKQPPPPVIEASWWEESTETEPADPTTSQELQQSEPASQAAGEHLEAAASETDQTVATLDTPNDPEPAPAEIEEPIDQEALIGEVPDGTRPLTDRDAPVITALRSRQGLAAAAMRDVGRVREINQDNVCAMLMTLPRESSDIPVGLFVVADGMGGHDGGEIASRLAVGTVVRQVLSDLIVPALDDGMTQALQPLVVSAVQAANRAIWEHAQTIGSDMGTTCTAALLLGHTLYIAHVGDSRAYLRTAAGLQCITRDHSAVGRLIQLGQLEPNEAREHPLRSQLYRTVGQQPEVMVDYIHQPVGDATHLLLCSDGLWSMLDEDVILDALDHTIWPHDACRDLIARANLAGGEDNISAVVVTLPA